MAPPPSRLGAWEIVRPLGAGGMGAVFVVEHAETRARRALKLVRAGPGRDLARARREVEALARVDGHPGVVRVHDCGEDEAQGALWIVMALAEGGDLAARLVRGPLPIPEVVTLGRALARGLAHVHARGVLHRDLKPANVLFDEHGAPKLVDFGVARVDDAARLTRSGDLVGTPQYLAPEALAGDAAAVDARADVWGLGVVLYEALTGAPPVDASDLLEYVARVGRGQVVAPSRRRPGVPPGLERVVLRALAPDRARRFQSARALGDALDALDAEGRAPRSSRLPIAGAVAVLVAGLVTVALRAGPGAPPTPTHPATEPAPAASSGSALSRLEPAAVAAALAREEPEPVLLALEARRAEVVAARCPADLRAALAGALLVAEDRAALARWREAGGAELRATLAGIDGLLASDPETRSPSPAPLPGHEGVAQRLRTARAAPLVSGPSPPGPLLDALEAALDAAGARLAEGPLEAALRVELARLVLSRDTSLAHTARRPADDLGAQPERLVARTLALTRAGPARTALQVLASWVAARRPGEGGSDPRRDPPSDAEADALPARYEALRFVHLARRFVAPPDLADPAAVEAQLARWPATFDLARRLALIGDDGRPTDVALLEETPRVGLAVDSFAGRGELLGRRAWFARAGPDARARWDEALSAAQLVQRSRVDMGLLLEARLHLQRGDVASARATLGRAPGGSDVRVGLRGELALLEGQLDQAEAAARELSGSDDDLFAVALRAWGASLGAAVAAARDDRTDALARVAQARALEATRPRPLNLTCPWRTAAETARQVEAARSGWRPWLSGRPWAP